MGTQTHEIAVIKPKPSSEEIIRLTSEYFDAKGREYDQFEKTSLKRDLFTEKVDQLIASEYRSEQQIVNVLTIACGTGRRERDIEALSGRSLNFTGVEISPEMCKLSAARGIEVLQGSWLNVPRLNKRFDSALLLSAFGHVPTANERLIFLSKIGDHLSGGGSLFLDVLNVDDKSEWGPKIDELFQKEDLASQGFDRGDVLYRKIGEPEVCFYHYFSTTELTKLLDQSGFSVRNLWYIGYGDSFGEIKESPVEGAIFVQAEKKG